MSEIHIVDTNNKLRRQFEKDGLALRNMFEWAWHEPSPIIFVFDGRNAKASRRTIYEGYKVGRIAAPDNFYKQLDIFRELITYTNKLCIRCDGHEADDVIAQMIGNNPQRKFVVHTNDGDFMRLVNENVRVTDPTIKDVAPGDIRLYKALVGDPSDKVPGIKLFGPKSWAKLEESHKQEWLTFLAYLELCHDNNAKPLMALGGLVLSESQQKWVSENWQLLVAFWRVVDFLPVSAEVISKGTVIGTPRYNLGDELLKELFL